MYKSALKYEILGSVVVFSIRARVYGAEPSLRGR